MPANKEDLRSKFEELIQYFHASDFDLLVKVHQVKKTQNFAYHPKFCKLWEQVEKRDETLPGYYEVCQWMVAQCDHMDPP